jgi:uncharacterized protein with FMN-binding domain
VRRAIVTTSATVSGIVLLLGLKPHSGTSSAQTKSFSIGSSDSAQAQTGTTGGSTDGGASGGSSSSGGSSGGSNGSSGGSAGGSTAPTQAPTTAPKQSGPTGTKVVAGESADTRYGPVQVQVTFSGKKITKIDVLQYPTQSGRDVEINDYALPILNQEAMTAQNAQIDAVSGATFTSDGYVQSLQSAIDKLGA